MGRREKRENLVTKAWLGGRASCGEGVDLIGLVKIGVGGKVMVNILINILFS
jgi:hypothetical protein